MDLRKLTLHDVWHFFFPNRTYPPIAVVNWWQERWVPRSMFDELLGGLDTVKRSLQSNTELLRGTDEMRQQAETKMRAAQHDKGKVEDLLSMERSRTGQLETKVSHLEGWLRRIVTAAGDAAYLRDLGYMALDGEDPNARVAVRDHRVPVDRLGVMEPRTAEDREAARP